MSISKTKRQESTNAKILVSYAENGSNTSKAINVGMPPKSCEEYTAAITKKSIKKSIISANVSYLKIFLHLIKVQNMIS